MDRWADLKPHWAGHMLRLKGSHHPEQRGIFYPVEVLQMSVCVCVCATTTVLPHVSSDVSSGRSIVPFHKRLQRHRDIVL